MFTGKNMFHPTENRVLELDEETYVDECAQRAMQSYLTRGSSTLTSADLAKICYKTAFEMLDHRNRLTRLYDPSKGQGMPKSNLTLEEFNEFAKEVGESNNGDLLARFMQAGVVIEIKYTDDGAASHYTTTLTYVDPATGQKHNYQIINTVPVFPKDL